MGDFLESAQLGGSRSDMTDRRLDLAASELRSRKLDLESRRLLMQLSPARLFSPKGSSVSSQRRNWQLCVKAFASRQEVASVNEIKVQRGEYEQTLKVYRPAVRASDPETPAIVWYHGGGFVFGDLYTAGATCRRLANETGCLVIAASYRLAPEYALETGLEDCIGAFRWAVTHGGDLGIDTNTVMVGGDSAGGALAALVAQRCKEDGGTRPAGQLLVYPATNLSLEYPPSEREGIASTAILIDSFAWLQDKISLKTNLKDPKLSPVLTADLTDLPPTVMLTAGFDPLRDEGLNYARRLAKAGVPVQVVHFPSQFHGFMSFDAVLRGAEVAFGRLGSVVKAMLRTAAPETRIDVVKPPSWGWSWLHPSQRLKELEVVCLLAKDLAHNAIRRTASEPARGASQGI